MTNIIRLINLTLYSWGNVDSYNPDFRDILVIINYIVTLFTFFISISTFLFSPLSLLDWGWARAIVVLLIFWSLAITYCKKYDAEN